MKSNKQNKDRLIALICVGTTILALLGLTLSVNGYQHANRDLLSESDVEDSLESFRQQKLDQQKAQRRKQRIEDKSKRLRKRRSTERTIPTSTETEFEETADWWNEDAVSEENFEQDDVDWETIGSKTARGLTRVLGLNRAERDSIWDLEKFISGLQVRFGKKILDDYREIWGYQHQDIDYRTGFNSASTLILKYGLKKRAHLDAYIRGFREGWLDPDQGSQIDPQDASYLIEE